jgi:hypothetical protein
MFEGWVRLAKVRAFRDQKIRGLRLLIDPNNPLMVSQCQYIDQPDDLFIQGYNVTLTGTTITFSSPAAGGPTPPIPPTLDFYQGQPYDLTLWNVIGSTQVPGSGDHLEVNGTGQVHLISAVLQANGSSGPANQFSLQPTVSTTLQFATPVPSSTRPMQVTLVNTSSTPVPYLSLGCYLDIELGTPNQDTVQITGFSSSTATATAAITGSGGITIALTAAGNGYVSTPNVTISGGGGSGATAVAQVANGVVVAVTLTSSGSGYTSPPAVTIDPPSTTVVATVTGMQNSHAAGATVQSHGISGIGPGSTFRIIRSPRIAGDEQLTLPTSIVIDFNTNNNTNYGPNFGNNPLPLTMDANGNATSLDLLFAPSGAVVTPGVATDFLALWVRNTNSNDPMQLGPTIIAVWARTGLITANPPNDGSADPYLFVRQ